MVAGNLIITRGEKGAYYIVNNILYHVAAPEINAVDTVGAGDNFHAAFALALAKGFDLHQAVKFSVAVASLSCREYGGRNGVPDWEQALAVAETLKERGIESI
jgi:sugar/nucleoside kinase (ribokinase family)